ncbi:MAG TPA: UPF0182 family protein, partial [Chloroflexota bacterium]|nr:UPF0182 family protein [Chloroflexota bacterium]
MPRPLARVLAVVTLLGAPLLLFGERLLSLYVDYLWFSALGYQSVFATGLWARLLSFALGVAIAMAIFLPNLWLARSIARRTLLRIPTRLVYQPPDPAPRPGRAGSGDPGLERPRPIADLLETMGGAAAGRSFVLRLGTAPLVSTALAVALVMGLTSGGQWESFLRALQAVPFATNDPVFGRDVAFYVFVLPALRFVQEWLAWAVLLSILMVSGLYLLALYGLDPTLAVGWLHLQRRALGMRSHVMGLLALLLGVFGAGIWLSTFDVLVARHPRMVGATFTDLHARLPATQALAATVALTALLVLVAIFRRSYSLPLVGGVLVAVVLVLGRGALPVLVQRLQVEPAEVSQERPYLATNIAFTRQAFGLVDVTEETFPAEEAVRVEDVRHNPATIANIRLWDHRPLRDAYNQLQSIRSYYAFDDVDIDRYVIDGQYRQVMLSARELAPERLGAQAQTWVNRRLQYTHGYGVVMSPVNEVSAEGPPTFFLQDVPPLGKLRVERPEIYYGEQTSGYVIVNTAVQEFDYPRGDQNAFTTYQGGGGVPLGPWWRRAALSLYFADFNLLVSSYLQPESQVLFRRQVSERVRRLAPYLKYDGDPYLVVENGRLYWLVDAYTITDQYPYSQLVQDQRLSRPGSAAGQGAAGGTAGFTPPAPLRRLSYNYIRNSVKVVMDAYDGTVTFYLADPSDPIISTYAAIFPELY